MALSKKRSATKNILIATNLKIFKEVILTSIKEKLTSRHVITHSHSLKLTSFSTID